MTTTTAPPTYEAWALGHIARLTDELATADTPAAEAQIRSNLASLRGGLRRLKEDEAAGAWWCVVTESGRRHVVAYTGNGGFGPVSVYEDGWFVHLKYRHRAGNMGASCACGTR